MGLERASSEVLPEGPVYSIAGINAGKRYAWAMWASRAAAESVHYWSHGVREFVAPLAAGEEKTRDDALRAVEQASATARQIPAWYARTYPRAEQHDSKGRARRELYAQAFGYFDILAIRAGRDPEWNVDFRDDPPCVRRAIRAADPRGRRWLVELLRQVHFEETGEDILLGLDAELAPPPVASNVIPLRPPPRGR